MKLGFFAEERIYGDIHYPQQVFLPIPKKTNGFWDFKGLTYLFLHENSQGLLFSQYSEENWTSGEYERKTNALSLLLSKEINRRFPALSFIDIKSLSVWIEEQLIGYDKGQCNIVKLKYAASRETRKRIRKKAS